MSAKELDRLGVIRRVLDGGLSQTSAATMLGLSARQVRRMSSRYGADGAAGLVSRKRGKPSNRRSPDELRERAVELVRARYADFGPTLASEKLAELHDLRVSRETLRAWMKDAGLWLTRKDRAPSPHQPRSRRDCLGELVQIDGCEHAWFEDRGPYCSLLVFVDDATGKLMEMRFVKTESAFGYFDATTSYLRRHGKPVAFYSDKHSIFRVNREGSTGIHRGVSQFGRALAELNIEIICANSPQAKGRVERMNLTLQNRLVKELRLREISNMEAGNAFAPEFMERFNARFAKHARSQHNAHRPMLPTEDLSQIFSWREVRTMTGNLVVHFERGSYVITPGPETSGLAGRRRRVEVRKWEDGRIEILHDHRALPYTVHDNYPYITPGDIVEKKRIAEVMATIQQAQRDGYRAAPAGKRVALRLDYAPSSGGSGDRKAPRRAEGKRLRTSALVGGDVRPTYEIRRDGERNLLYERTSVRSGRQPAKKAQRELLGDVDQKVARRWEERGNIHDPPPLAAARVPEIARERIVREAAAHADGVSRLSAALWFADAFHAAEMQRMKEFNDAADDLARSNSGGPPKAPLERRREFVRTPSLPGKKMPSR